MGWRPADRTALTCFIPKAAAPQAAAAVPQLPLATRPVTLLNITYKVAAAFANTYLAEALPFFIDKLQRGFLKGRLGIEHVLDLEAAAFALASRGGCCPAIVLLDIEAAFPSLAHRFLVRALRRFAGDHPITAIIEDL